MTSQTINYLFQLFIDDLRGHLFLCNLSFNSKTLSLDVEGCYGLTCVDIVSTCGFFFGKKYCINTSIINVEHQTLLYLAPS